MKNLQLLILQRWGVQEIPENAQGCITHVGCDSKNFYFISNGYLFSLNIETKIITQLCEERRFENIISFDVLEFENRVVIGNGEVLYVYCIASNSLGEIDFGSTFETLVFNPTQESIIVYFTDGRISNFSPDYFNFDLYKQGEAHINDAVPQTVYVGWGSENTQFQGSKGKVKPEKPPKIEVEDVNDKVPRISWRGNGEMFVVNYWKENKRFFKVFESPCKPVYECRDNSGLQAVISWRPEGNMIATSVFINGQRSIMISEKNGLKRFQFDLQHIKEEVAEIKWSPCSKVLAILQKHKEGGSSLNLFTTSNYKWYLKQHLFFAEDNPLKAFFWNSQVTSFQNSLVVATNTEIICYTFKNEILRSKNFATCAVIDGKNILWSFFENTKICPPLANVTTTLLSPVNFISFHPAKELVAIITSDKEIIICSFNVDNNEIKEVSHTKIIDLNILDLPLSIHTLHWENHKKENVSFVAEDSFIEGDLMIYKFQDGEFKKCASENKDLIDIVSLQHSTAITKLYLDKIVINGEHNSTTHNISFLPLQLAVEIVNFEIHTFLLTVGNKFYVDDCIVSENVTSFLTRGKYLLITVSDNKLFCIPMYGKEITLLRDKNLVCENFFYRNIEQGSIIISADQNSPSVVLQMPRGNIEVISSIFIAIDMLEKLLSKNKWKDAIYFIRIEKLDWNLLIDLNPERFLTHINQIVEACETSAVFSNICIEFTDDNVLNTKYKKWADETLKIFPKKRTKVCQKIINYLKEIDYTYYFNLILFINIHHFTIREALIYLQDIIHSFEEDPTFEEIASKGVKLLKTYILEDKLYTEALKMYDLKLARYIASFCQMDPRVYEPQLQKLSEMSEVERRFEINVLLKNYDDAVIYLLRMPNLDKNTLRTFIKKNSVSKTAYKYNIRQDPDDFQNLSKEVTILYSEHLSYKGLHMESGSILFGEGLFELALHQYKTCLAVNKVISTMDLINYDTDKKNVIYEDLADKLFNSKNYKEAARIYGEYLGKNDLALRVLLEGKYFEEAYAFYRKVGSFEVGSDKIMTAALDSYVEQIFYKIKQLNSSFEEYKNRLSVVRTLGENIFKGGYKGGYNDESDLFSDAGSQTSKRSSKSNRSRSSTSSSKLRRKQARKVQDLREGGVYEDIALVKALYDKIAEAFSLGNEVRSLCLVMVEETNIQHDNIKTFHNALVKLHFTIRNGIKEIWPECFSLNYPSKTISEIVINKNIEFLDEKYRKPPDTSSNDWKLSLFE